MRAIKFRAKYKDSNCWAYSNTKRMSVFWKDEEDGFFIDGTIGQFTGLHDKNGKEIYEGDVAKITYVDGDFHETKIQHTELGVMEFNNISAQFCFKCEESLFQDYADDMNVEVIGNIYEHPDLLK